MATAPTTPGARTSFVMGGDVQGEDVYGLFPAIGVNVAGAGGFQNPDMSRQRLRAHDVHGSVWRQHREMVRPQRRPRSLRSSEHRQLPPTATPPSRSPASSQGRHPAVSPDLREQPVRFSLRTGLNTCRPTASPADRPGVSPHGGCPLRRQLRQRNCRHHDVRDFHPSQSSQPSR